MIKIRPLLANLLLSFTALLLCLAAVELTLRATVYNFKPYPKAPGPNSTYPFKTEEFSTIVHLNSLYMRDREIAPKRQGETRILCLGDSFTFGLGVSYWETYPKFFEKILAGDGRTVSVVNGGTGGYAANAYEFLMKTGLSFKPDWVIEQIYVGNDFYDGMDDKWQPTAEKALEPHVKHSPLSDLKAFVRGMDFKTLDFLWSRLVQFPVIDDFLYSHRLRMSNRGIYLKEYPALERELVKNEFAQLKKIKDACDRNGVHFLILVVPEKQQLFERKHVLNDKYDYRKPHRLIEEFCRQNGIPRVDLLDAYDKLPESRVRSFYYRKDQHWTRAGHEYAAKVLADFFASQGGFA